MKKKKTTNTQQSVSPTEAPKAITSYLEVIASKRTGGAINFRGMGYQLLYTTCQLLQLGTEKSWIKSVRLEGLEDVDLYGKEALAESEHVQIKTSQNPLDAGKLWSLKVVQNFLTVYERNPTARFRLVYNMPLEGHLRSVATGYYSPPALAYWQGKLGSMLANHDPAAVQAFLKRITFEHATSATWYNQLVKTLLADYQINLGTEEQFVKALFYHAFEWSQARAEVRAPDVRRVLQAVTDSYSKAPINEALRHRWIASVSFDSTGPDEANATAYFEGQAAQPWHIAQHLPVARPEWRQIVESYLTVSDVVVIKASSGQGKSTLAWQVAFESAAHQHQVYQLAICTRDEEVNSICEFLLSRVQIGEFPLVVIDGLSGRVREWAQVVEQLSTQPIKFLITAREEDWCQYQADINRVRLQVVDLVLSAKEAADVYQELRRRKRVSSLVTAWQPAWEAVRSRGLLIEYVYLLTRGELLRDRLSNQVRAINQNQNDRDAAAKVELLRLVSVADCLNLRLDTVRLLKQVQQTVGFGSDRGHVVQQVEREYLISFSSRQVEGLHPVRSRHLLELLHVSVPLEESLLSVFQLLKGEDSYNFFIAVADLLSEGEEDKLYERLAALVAEREFLAMTGALDGLLHVAAQHYWLTNRKVFDEVFDKGGLEIFVLDTMPFTKVELLRGLNNTMGEPFSNLSVLLAKLGNLQPFSPADSDLMRFAHALHTHLSRRTASSIYENVGLLAAWLSQLGLDIPGLAGTEPSYLLQELSKKSILEVSELFLFSRLFDPVQHQTFLDVNTSAIISQLKIKTDTPTLEIVDNELHLTYVLPLNIGEANDLSVSRLQAASAMLPFYKQYCSKAVVFPFPNEEFYQYSLQSAVKHMSGSILGNPYNQRVNQIWSNTILDNYRADSMYDWQAAQCVLRTEAINFAQLAVRLLEAKLEQNAAQYKRSVRAVNAQADILDPLMRQRRSLPRASRRYLVKPAQEAQERQLNDWLASMRNFVHQFTGLLESTDKHHLPALNLKAANHKLAMMQQAVQTVAIATYPYFSLEALEIDEQKVYGQLLETVEFYVQWLKNGDLLPVYNVRPHIKQWAGKERSVKLNRLASVLRAYEAQSSLKFHLPTSLVQDESLTYAVIGVEGLDVTNQAALEHFWIGLAELGNAEITFFTFFQVEQGATHIGFRYSDDFFQQIAQLMVDGAADVGELRKPFPVLATDELLIPLPGVTFLEPIPTIITPLFSLNQQLWELTQYRARLNKQIPAETQWLRSLEQTCQLKIDSCLEELSGMVSKQDYTHYAAYAARVLLGEYTPETHELVALVNN